MENPKLSLAKAKKEKFRRYQYTKPYKDRDRTKDFGKDLPLKKNRRLKFPEKPQYYTLYTAQKLPPNHPFYNLRNKDMNALAKAVKQAKEALKRPEKNCESEKPSEDIPKKIRKQSISHSLGEQSLLLRSSMIQRGSQTQQQYCSSNKSSLGIVTITDKSNQQKICPFKKGYSITSGPKVYRDNSKISISDHKSAQLRTPIHSILSQKSSLNEPLSDNYLNKICQHSERPSV